MADGDTGARGLTVDERNKVPLYHQLFLILRGKIHDGEYKLGMFLPGELELAAMYNVSRITANRALNELAASGLAVREKGRGTRVLFVADGKILRGPADEPDAAIGAVREGRAEVDLLRFEYLAAPPEAASALRIPAGTVVQHAVRRWRFNAKPFAHLTTYIPRAVGAHWSEAEMGRDALSALLNRAGIVIERIDETVTATLADIALAQVLEVAVGSPLIKIVRTSYDREGRGVEYLLAYYPPERYQYRASLTRQDGDVRRRAAASPVD